MGSALSGPWDIPAKSLHPMVSGLDCFENFGAYAVPKHSLNHELEADRLFASHTSTKSNSLFLSGFLHRHDSKQSEAGGKDCSTFPRAFSLQSFLFTCCQIVFDMIQLLTHRCDCVVGIGLYPCCFSIQQVCQSGFQVSGQVAFLKDIIKLHSLRGRHIFDAFQLDQTIAQIRLIENHKFLMFFLPLKSKIESPCRRNANFHS